MNNKKIVENGLKHFNNDNRPEIIFQNNYDDDNSVWFSYYSNPYTDTGIYSNAVAIFKIKYHDNKN